MPRFLWVEDFDTEPASYRDTTHFVFGCRAGNRDEIPDEKEDLRDYLASKDIVLETTLSTALQFIAEPGNLATIDFVVLDIDLKISEEREDEVDNKLLNDIFERHGDSSEERTKLKEIKKIAGYYIWTSLVIDMGFPRNRIQFCSNHGNFLKSINESFVKARITPPQIFTKTDKKICTWIELQNSDQYISFRRNVVDYCQVLINRLNEADAPQDLLALHKFPGKNTCDFTKELADEILEALPKYLPINILTEHQDEVLRSFMRRLTVEWDRFDTKDEFCEKLEKEEGINYSRDTNRQTKASASLLKLIRNTLSHSSGKPIHITCELAAFYFVLNMRTIFQIEPSNNIEHIEDKFFPQVVLNDGFSNNVYDKLSFMRKSVVELSKHCNIKSKHSHESKYFISDLLRQLQMNSIKEYQEKSLVYGILFLWCELSKKPLDKSDNTEFKRNLQNMLTSSNITDRLAVACLSCILK